MIAMQEHKNFWDKNAGRYDRFMRKDQAAYDEMYVLKMCIRDRKSFLKGLFLFIWIFANYKIKPKLH